MSRPEVPWRDRLRFAVGRTGKKQSYIAELAGISPETLSRILSGRHRKPSFDAVVSIARACRVTVAWVLNEPSLPLTEGERATLQSAGAILRQKLDVPPPNAVYIGHGKKKPNGE